jgi:integrase
MGPGPITWDALLPCFGVRPGTRTKTWIVAIDGSKHRVGHYPAMKVAEARDKARGMLEGGAPAESVKFKEVVDEFLQRGRTRKGRELRQNSVDQYRRVFNRYAKPLHKRVFAEITRRDVAELLRKVATSSGATTASLVRSMLRRLWAFGIETGEVEYNVVENTPGYAVAKRKRVLSDGELAAIWSATEDGEAFSLIVRLLLWTGARRGEVGGMRWSEMAATDAGMIWHVPGSRVKNGRDLILPLPEQARAALQVWPRVVGKDTLFGVWSPRGFNGWSGAKSQLDERLVFDRDWDLHDLRRTVETRLIGLGVSRDHVNRILNHAQGPIDEAYSRYEYLRAISKRIMSATCRC